MLMPYASHQHGEGAFHLPWKEVKELALNYGAMYSLFENELEVGCVIGRDFFCNNERYWNSSREGFPNYIFDDNSSRSKKSIIMTYLEIKSALTNGFDYYDLGHSQSFTEAGATHYKRGYGAKLNARGDYNYFYLRLPKTIAAQFYWEKPVFALEGSKVVLHLGLPDGVSSDALAQRYSHLNYRGLSKVYLHCDSAPSSAHTEAVMNIYSYQRSPPVIKVCYAKFGI